ncbi:MAG: FtsW/RodA/SpoVE family cell cycle protein [Phycisphaerales bacterium]
MLGPQGRLATWAWLCVAAGLGLSLLGIYAIDVASASTAPQSVDEVSPRAVTQMIFLAAGLLAAAIVALPDERVVRLLAWPALGVVVALLIFVLLPFVPASIVRPRNGCRGWIDLGWFDLQPSELAKIAYVLAAAEYLRHSRNHRTLIGLVPPAAITMIPIGLIMLEPDLGMALLFVPAVFAMLLCAGARLKHLSAVVAAAVIAGSLMFPVLKPHQQQRIVSLIKQIRGDAAAASDPDLFQAATAVMLTGAGRASGYDDEKARAVVRFSRLPERHNDMVFSVIVARFGLLGGLGVLALYGTWLIGALLTAACTREPFCRLVIAGLVAIVASQTVINIGMNVGVVPIIGLTLPMVSYGGSSMLAVWMMNGLILGVGLRRPHRLSREPEGLE